MIGTKDFMDVGTDRGGGWLATKRLVVWGKSQTERKGTEERTEGASSPLFPVEETITIPFIPTHVVDTQVGSR